MKLVLLLLLLLLFLLLWWGGRGSESSCSMVKTVVSELLGTVAAAAVIYNFISQCLHDNLVFRREPQAHVDLLFTSYTRLIPDFAHS